MIRSMIKSNDGIPAKTASLMASSEQHKKSGLTKAGQILEVEAAFEICNSLDIPIYKKEHPCVDDYLDEKHQHISYSTFCLLDEYPHCVPENILEKLMGLDKHYPSLYILVVKPRFNAHQSITRMQEIDVALDKTEEMLLEVAKRDIDPILLYRFDWGDYYMELARWD